MWRKNAFCRLIFPVPVFLKRLAAPLCVFNFGMIFSSLAFGKLNDRHDRNPGFLEQVVSPFDRVCICFFPINKANRGRHPRVSRSRVYFDRETKLRNVYDEDGVV